MKKVLFILGAAALVLASCAKSETVVKETQQEIGFKAISSPATKGSEYTQGTLAADAANWLMYVSAIQKDPAGTSQEYFKDVTFKYDGSSSWKAYDLGTPDWAPVYWPVGGSKLDFVAYAYNAAAKPNGTASWPAGVFTNEGTPLYHILTFTNVDTYGNQSDVVYAVKNAQATTASSVALAFDHAQALLIFNVKNTSDVAVTVNDIAFISAETHTAANNYANAIAKEKIFLKTKGTFTVNNGKINPEIGWSALDSQATVATSKANAAMPSKTSGSEVKSALNTVATGIVDYSTALGTGESEFRQIGSTLLIPEQEKVNFNINYTVGSNTMNYTNNELRGTWEMGKVYIYNITIGLREITFTETVTAFKPGTANAVTLE